MGVSDSAQISGIRTQVQRILATGALGRSRFYSALLQYLLDCSERGHTPKEIEIAAEVFNRGDQFDPSQDSMVRVYAHNLRQKLEQYYADQGSAESEQVSIPKGEYRLVLIDAVDETPVPAAPQPRPENRFRGAIAAAILASLVVGIVLGRVSGPDTADIAAGNAVAASPLWAGLTDDDTPVTIVVGDYYIFGELDRYGNIARMVREFDINSVRDLDEQIMLDPERSGTYMDLELTYIPTSAASAIQNVMNVLAQAGKDVRVVATSHLDTVTIRETHIVYVGYLSALGMLQDFVFAGSELAFGETFDELVHKTSGQVFISEAGRPSGERSYRDYGYFSSQPGPGGNQLVVIAGTRDEGLMQTAESVSNQHSAQSSVKALAEPDAAEPEAFEILYEVAGLYRTNLNSTIVHAARLTSSYLAMQ